MQDHFPAVENGSRDLDQVRTRHGGAAHFENFIAMWVLTLSISTRDHAMLHYVRGHNAGYSLWTDRFLRRAGINLLM